MDEISKTADFVIGVAETVWNRLFYDGDKVFVERCQIIETGKLVSLWSTMNV